MSRNMSPRKFKYRCYKFSCPHFSQRIVWKKFLKMFFTNSFMPLSLTNFKRGKKKTFWMGWMLSKLLVHNQLKGVWCLYCYSYSLDYCSVFITDFGNTVAFTLFLKFLVLVYLREVCAPCDVCGMWVSINIFNNYLQRTYLQKFCRRVFLLNNFSIGVFLQILYAREM